MKPLSLFQSEMDNSVKPVRGNAPLFYKIGEVCRITGVKSFVLRFWENEFPSLVPQRNSGGQRVYTKKDVELILTIKNLLYKEGLTILGARARLEGQVALRAFPKNTLGWVKQELEDIMALLSQG